MTSTDTRAPLVSVIMPARDAERTVNESIASVVGQTISDWELLIVDDASGDETVRSVAAWSAGDPRIRLTHGSGKGPGAARNQAIDVARGRFIHFLDADDLLRADALATLSDAALQQGVQAVFGAYERLGPDGHPLDWVCRESLSEVGLDELLERNRFPVHAQLISREALGNARFDASLAAVEDWDFWLSLAHRGVRWKRIDSIVADYRQGLVTRSSRFRAVNDATRGIIHKAFTAALHGRQSPQWDLSETRMRRVLWAHAFDTATLAASENPSAGVEIALIARSDAGPCVLGAMDAARCAFWLLPTARGRGPQDWRSQNGFESSAAAAVGFWRGLEQAGVFEPGFRDDAMAELALLLAPRGAIAQEVIAHCAGALRVRLLGHGANGRFLADAFRARGVEVAIAERVADIDPLDPAAGPLILTPINDAGFMRELPPGAAAVRWSQVQGRIAEQWMVRLRSVVDKGIESKRGAA